ncbi:Mu transposase C-terminal domain-containing protein [Bradyrhizobium sp. SZCCHNR3107]|uniref:Mu transposase C-terminal domain-containing protein n=1 Tax=Bradyrhizobium sp. SZCCHNR3107 TaxID=3057459 RepID=UPI0028E43449|nr:Mu transposase C-terminal domain-containing protein [Bradyrhizobium sp. SZCCHNR3107]
MAKINIGSRDRIMKGNTELRPVSCSDDGYVFVRAGSVPELHEDLTHDQIKRLIDSSALRIDRDWYEEGNARARLIAGVDSLSDLPREEANELIRREYFVTEFLKREANDKNVKRTDASIWETILSIDASRLQRNARCDQALKRRKPPSARTFRRWLSAYEKDGFNVLALRNRYRNSGNPYSNMDPEVYRLLTSHAASYCDERRPTISHVFRSLKAEIAKLNLERSANGISQLTCPAKSTLSRKIKALNQFEVYASRHGISKARAKFAIVSTGLDVTRPLQHVQIDEWSIQLHTIAADLGLSDVMTAEDRRALKMERLKVCLVLDVATRCVLGFRISSRTDASNAIATLAMVVSDKNSIAKTAGCKSDWPMGGPPSLVSPDAGPAFIDEHFRGCIANLKAVYENAPASLSYLRGHVERVFGSIHTGLTPHFTGRSFTNVVDKGEYESENRASIFTKQLPRLFVRWIVDVYHHTPHEGLGQETPYLAWKRLTDLYGIAAPPNAHQRREIFGVELERNLHPRGVRVQGLYYQSEALQVWRRQVGDTTVTLRFDPLDIGYVSVWIGNSWLTVPSVRAVVRGVNLYTWLDAVTDLKRTHQENARHYEHIVHDAIRAIAQTADQAIRRTAVFATRPTVDELNHVESGLMLGFDFVDNDAPEEVPKATLLDGGIPVASAQSPSNGSDAPAAPVSRERRGHLED